MEKIVSEFLLEETEGKNLFNELLSVNGNLSRPDDSLNNTEDVSNKGPLLNTVTALFGKGSFLENYANTPEVYATNGTSMKSDPCTDLLPFGQLLKSAGGNFTALPQINECFHRPDTRYGRGTLVLYAGQLVVNFQLGNKEMKNAFTVAAYLANRAWITNVAKSGMYSRWLSLSVAYDLGTDTQRPTLSSQAMIVLSVLIGVFLSLLWAVTIYATFLPRWTDKLDAYALLRCGASMHEKVSLLSPKGSDSARFLDENPGWVGDKEGDKGMGQIALGGITRLRQGRKYSESPCVSSDVSSVQNRNSDV